MRIAIVNDVPLAVEAVRRVVLGTAQHELAWIAQDGLQAVELCARDKPDLILMDLIMPRIDGAEATRRIMAATPCPIVVVTANVTDNSSKVFEAMGAGALDAVNTPVLLSPGGFKGAQMLLTKIETIGKLIGVSDSPKPPSARPLARERHFPPSNCLVALGASAGGPSAVLRILEGLPADFPAAILIVQHVDEQFAQGLANWLDRQVRLPVRLAQDGETPRAGTVLLAGRDSHLVMTPKRHLAYTRQPADCSYRPSIDVFFKSVSRYWPGEKLAVLLTGMGRDGAEGLRMLRSEGSHTIAQDEATSAVYGMPKAAAELQAATEILPLDRIGPRVNSLVRRTALHV
jgi:two-component system response regulator WspF